MEEVGERLGLEARHVSLVEDCVVHALAGEGFAAVEGVLGKVALVHKALPVGVDEQTAEVRGAQKVVAGVGVRKRVRTGDGERLLVRSAVLVHHDREGFADLRAGRKRHLDARPVAHGRGLRDDLGARKVLLL